MKNEIVNDVVYKVSQSLGEGVDIQQAIIERDERVTRREGDGGIWAN